MVIGTWGKDLGLLGGDEVVVMVMMRVVVMVE